MNSSPVIKVAIPSPVRQSFDYLLPVPKSEGRLSLSPGTRVRVPFGNRQLIGLVIEANGTSDIASHKLKAIIEIIDDTPIFDSSTLALYIWASRYYQYPLGQALQTSLPKYVREGRSLIIEPEAQWQINAHALEQDITALHRAPQQLKMFNLFKYHQTLSLSRATLLLNAPAKSFINALYKKNLLVSFNEISPDPSEPITQGTNDSINYENVPLTLNTEQKQAISEVSNTLGTFQPFLLEGITGSGKTEVYLQLIQEVLQKNQQVLVLVPEINLTPQTIERFEKRFKHTIAALHSGLNDSQRFNAWLDARNGKASIIIGTRSAIFTPLSSPGLIIIDEEHDSSYKQQEGFRYHARDLAIYRARLHNIPILLGSATPCLESLNNALSSRYHLLKLAHRAGKATLPSFNLIDLKNQHLHDGFSSTLLDSIKGHLTNGNQVLVFINRRGYSPLLQCHECGWIAACTRCDTSYTLHQHPPGLHCHHCDSQIPLMTSCPQCHAPDLSAIGIGTERTESILSSVFPEYPTIRIDRDSTRAKGSLEKILETVNTGQPCILIGTQMLAKGHHFPDVTLVAVLDADNGLFSPDIRGQEHMGQLLIQVAGRAGRSDKPGEVLIQTFHSTHPAFTTLINSGYAQFSRQLLIERQQTNLPPFTYLILFRAEASQRSLPERFLLELKSHCLTNCKPSITILGPMPSPMEKRAGRFRAQLLLQSTNRADLHELSHLLLGTIERSSFNRKVRWSIDVDPIDFT